MALLTPFLSLNSTCDEALTWLKERLATANLRVVQTFDLHSARHSLESCPCPHHGTEQCNCQLVVLLVYAGAVEPVTLILHGHNGQTWLSLVEQPDQQAEDETIIIIRRALEIETSTYI